MKWSAKGINRLSVTPYDEVNAVLDYFKTHLEALLGDHLLGMYVIGSLALGDFNPQKSDIDFVVLVDGEITEDLYTVLQAFHADFAAGEFPWAKRIETVYVTPDAFDLSAPNPKPYPQVETEFGGVMFRAPLEDGWVFQCQSLREHPLIVLGPHPRTMIQPITRRQMFPPASAITGMWLDQSQNDPTWIPWVRPIPHQKFVVLTLCRLLYSMATGDIASKPAAGKWALAVLPQRWCDFIDVTLANTGDGDVSQALLDETIAFVRYTFERSQLQ